MSHDPRFRRALVTEDEAYLMAERELRESPERAEMATEALEHPDPVARLMADVVLEWAEAEDHPFSAALRDLDDAEQRFAGTVVHTPPVRAMVGDLSDRYGGRLAELLALRLVKQPEQASWRVLVTLGYLDRHKTPAVTEALIRFAATSPHAKLQQTTARVIAGLGDPDLPRKLAAERDRLARQGAAIPPALAALGGTPASVA
jgi:HEAT repeat protein